MLDFFGGGLKIRIFFSNTLLIGGNFDRIFKK